MAENEALSSAVGLLAHLSIDELKAVLNDDDKFDNITKDANIAAQNIGSSEREMLIASNKSLAEYNLSRAEEFQEKKSKLVDIYEELQRINASVEEKCGKLKELTNKSNPEVVLALLQTAASESEAATDEIAEKFLNNELKLDGFLEQFTSRRKAMHLRKAKAEKMAELISRRLSYKGPQPIMQQQSRITTITQYNTRNAYNPNYSNAPVSVPYPLGPVNMPMPNNYMPNHF